LSRSWHEKWRGAHRHGEPTGRASARPMTGSAKQSISPGARKVDCFVASLPCANASRLSQAMTLERSVDDYTDGAPPPSLAAVDLPAHDRDRLLIDLGCIPGFDRCEIRLA